MSPSFHNNNQPATPTIQSTPAGKPPEPVMQESTSVQFSSVTTNTGIPIIALPPTFPPGARSVVKDLFRPSSGELKLSKVHDHDSRGQVVFSSKFYSEDLKVDDVPELKLSINELAVDDTFVLNHIKFKLVQPQCVLKETFVAKSSTPTNMHNDRQSAPSRQYFACPPAPRSFSPVAGPRCLSLYFNDSRHASTQQDWN